MACRKREEMSEITFETGHLPVCVDCQVKHAVDLKAHVEPGTPRHEEVAGLVEKIRKDLTMSKEQMSDYEKIRKVEHKLEDYQAVLREARHRLQEETEPSGANPNPIPEKCSFEKEVKLEKEHFDPHSFRTLCPQCPQSRCALCPPELACATRIIIGCRKGEFVEGRCRVGTESHVIYHGKA